MFSCSSNDVLEEQDCNCVLETVTVSVKTINGLPVVVKSTSTTPIEAGCEEDGIIVLDTKLIVKTIKCNL